MISNTSVLATSVCGWLITLTTDHRINALSHQEDQTYFVSIKEMLDIKGCRSCKELKLCIIHVDIISLKQVMIKKYKKKKLKKKSLV